MKPVSVLLLNVVTVAVALLVYDIAKDEARGAPPARAPSSRSGDATVADLERRVRALEARPLAAPEAAGVFEEPAAVPVEETRRPVERGASFKSAEPTEADVERFIKLRAVVHARDRVKKNRARVDKALDRMTVRLTSRQREGIHEAFAAFQPRVEEIWTEVKAQARATADAGGKVDRGEIVTATMARINQEFAATLTGIVPNLADADAVAEALMPGK